MLSDNHMHTQYCPHGSDAEMEEYVKAAIGKGLKELTFTEHAPLVIDDPTPENDSAMSREDVEAYINEGKELKEKYKDKLTINIGFEIDYIEGKEEETLEFLKKHSDLVPHSILSVHMIRLSSDEYFCIDYDKDAFLEKISEVGYDTLVSKYEDTLYKALSNPYGELTPRTIGHITLINKFEKAHDQIDTIDWISVLKHIKEKGYRMDYNFAGLDKPYHKQTYPPEPLVKKAIELAIPLRFGSDAHHPDEVGRYFERSLKK